MFWFGVGITLCSGLISISTISKLIKYYIAISDLYLDISRFALLLIGLVLAIMSHIDLDTSIKALRDYSDISQLNGLGEVSLGDGLETGGTPISSLLEGTFIRKGRKVYPKCDAQSLAKFQAAIKQFPKFPFSYYVVALCLYYDNDPTWKRYALDAIKILKLTTMISGHSISHDDALKQLQGLLLQQIFPMTSPFSIRGGGG